MSYTSILPRIRGLAAYVPGLSIDEIREKYGLDEVIKLASNENPLGASPLAVEAVRKNAEFIFRYPQGGNPALRKAVARLHGVDPELIAIGNGSDEIIDLLIRLTTDAGRHNIVCFQPCFSLYPIQGDINGAEIRRVPLNEDFSFNFQELLARTDANTRLVFITTPDNPSGYCPPFSEVKKLASGLAEKSPHAMLVVDEAYMDFSSNEKEFSFLAQGILPENVAILRTFSKSWGLAGMRLGYAILPPAFADVFWRARLPFSVNILAESAALAAMRDDAFRSATLNTVAEGREYLRAGLKDAGCRVWPSQANFLMFQTPAGSISARECCEQLLKHGIIIRSLASYALPGHMRVSVGNARENRKFIAALQRVLADK